MRSSCVCDAWVMPMRANPHAKLSITNNKCETGATTYRINGKAERLRERERDRTKEGRQQSKTEERKKTNKFKVRIGHTNE